MSFLLDTSTFLWFVTDDKMLSTVARRVLEAEKIHIMTISVDHLKHVADMPVHHRDPVDILLIAQSQVEGIPVMSNDAAFDHYAIQRLW